MKLLCESVCFSYSGKQWIFENYNRVFTSGITILKGYSGCGKTTLLKILAGYLSPQRGRVITPRRKVQADSLYRRKEVSYMFQGLNLRWRETFNYARKWPCCQKSSGRGGRMI